MPVIQSLIDNDAIFRNLKEIPIIINELHNSTSEDRNFIERLISTTYSSDMVSILPSCKCGLTKGEFSRNTICEHCKTPVSAAIENTVEPLIWFRRPEGVEKLLNPIIWIMLDKRFKKSNFSIMRWFTDTSYSTQIRKPPVLDKIIASGFKRGYNHFVQNFFSIIEFLLDLKDYKKKGQTKDYLLEFLHLHRDHLFSDHIPLINKSLLIIEKTSLATYVDSTVPLALDAIQMLISIDKDYHDQSTSVKENRTAKALHLLSEFFDTYFRRIVAKKTGLIRHYAAGSRFDFSAYAVISSITDEHRYDEIEIPWGVGVTIFRPMIISKLIKNNNMLINDAVGLILSHVGTYHPLLDQYMKEIISSTKTGRYPVIINRFPSLLQGSIQQVYISKVKTDTHDRTISFSILTVTAPNADFDGDKMSIYLSLDEAMADMWYSLHPKFNIWGMEEPFKITGNIKLPKPIVATIGTWLADED